MSIHEVSSYYKGKWVDPIMVNYTPGTVFKVCENLIPNTIVRALSINGVSSYFSYSNDAISYIYITIMPYSIQMLIVRCYSKATSTEINYGLISSFMGTILSEEYKSNYRLVSSTIIKNWAECVFSRVSVQ